MMALTMDGKLGGPLPQTKGAAMFQKIGVSIDFP